MFIHAPNNKNKKKNATKINMFCFKYILLFLLKHQHTNYTTTCCFVTYVFLLNNKLNKANKFVDFVIKLCVYRVIPLNINFASTKQQARESARV